MNCPDCGWPIYGTSIYKTDPLILICPRCEAQIELSARKIKDGKPGFTDTVDLKGNLLVRDPK